eukprot:7841148-Alexandrium_andersonii.AAC.1
MADCGLRRIGALTGLGWIANCTLDTLLCKDARQAKIKKGPTFHMDEAAAPESPTGRNVLVQG